MVQYEAECYEVGIYEGDSLGWLVETISRKYQDVPMRLWRAPDMIDQHDRP